MLGGDGGVLPSGEVLNVSVRYRHPPPFLYPADGKKRDVPISTHVLTEFESLQRWHCRSLADIPVGFGTFQVLLESSKSSHLSTEHPGSVGATLLPATSLSPFAISCLPLRKLRFRFDTVALAMTLEWLTLNCDFRLPDIRMNSYVVCAESEASRLETISPGIGPRGGAAAGSAPGGRTAAARSSQPITALPDCKVTAGRLPNGGGQS